MTLPRMVMAAMAEEEHRAAAAALEHPRTRTRKPSSPRQTSPPALTEKFAYPGFNVPVEDAGDIENTRESTDITETTEDQRASARSAEHQIDDLKRRKIFPGQVGKATKGRRPGDLPASWPSKRQAARTNLPRAEVSTVAAARAR